MRQQLSFHRTGFSYHAAADAAEGRVRLESGTIADAQVRLFDLTDYGEGPLAHAMTMVTGDFFNALTHDGTDPAAAVRVRTDYPIRQSLDDLPYQLAARRRCDWRCSTVRTPL